jgi:hypothetical protein
LFTAFLRRSPPPAGAIANPQVRALLTTGVMSFYTPGKTPLPYHVEALRAVCAVWSADT